MVVVTVGLMAYIVNLSTAREFRQYISQGGMMYIQSITSSLAQFYSQEQSWVGVQNILPNLLGSQNDRIVIPPTNGWVKI
jgi:hypothetical protein